MGFIMQVLAMICRQHKATNIDTTPDKGIPRKLCISLILNGSQASEKPGETLSADLFNTDLKSSEASRP